MVRPASAINIDSLAQIATVYAAENNIKELRPLMEQWGNQMPSFVRLYCDIPLANAEGNPARTIACVDSLTRWFPRQLNRTSQLSLSVAKAAGLQQLGKYKDLLSYCSAELKKYRKWKFHEEDLEELLRLQRKAQRLAGNSPRQRFLQWADRDMARPIDSLWNEAETSLDSFALTRCAFTLENGTLLSQPSRRQLADSLTAIPTLLTRTNWLTVWNIMQRAWLPAANGVN